MGLALLSEHPNDDPKNRDNSGTALLSIVGQVCVCGLSSGQLQMGVWRQLLAICLRVDACTWEPPPLARIIAVIPAGRKSFCPNDSSHLNDN